jgi:hypothetical protein
MIHNKMLSHEAQTQYSNTVPNKGPVNQSINQSFQSRRPIIFLFATAPHQVGKNSMQNRCALRTMWSLSSPARLIYFLFAGREQHLGLPVKKWTSNWGKSGALIFIGVIYWCVSLRWPEKSCGWTILVHDESAYIIELIRVRLNFLRTAPKTSSFQFAIHLLRRRSIYAFVCLFIWRESDLGICSGNRQKNHAAHVFWI